MKVLVCGGRDFRDARAVFDALDWLSAESITEIIHGDARGADSIADVWACLRDIDCARYPADWRPGGIYDPKAGPKRNQRMLDERKPDLCLAFKGGAGTHDMMNKAKAASVEVMTWPVDKRLAEPRLSKLMGERI